MEIQHVPSTQADDANGETYARVAPTRFPVTAEGHSALVHRISAYNKDSLWNSLKAWFDGGAPADGTINPAAVSVHPFKGNGGATWKIYPDKTANEDQAPLAWTSFATPMARDPTTFGFKWNDEFVTKTKSQDGGSLVTLPEYFHRKIKVNKKPEWVVVQKKVSPPRQA